MILILGNGISAIYSKNEVVLCAKKNRQIEIPVKHQIFNKNKQFIEILAGMQQMYIFVLLQCFSKTID